MARNIKRHVLAGTNSGSAAKEPAKEPGNEGSPWRRDFENPDPWIEEGNRRESKRSETPRGPESNADVSRSRDTSALTKSSGVGRAVAKSLLFGLAGGLAATFVMTQAQTAWQKVNQGDQAQQPKSEEEQQREVGEQSTVKIADRVSKILTHREVSQEYKQTAGNTVHYAFGTVMGGVYGALSGLIEDAPFGTGILFGIGMWLAADEFLLPYLGLSQRPQEKDLKEHAYEASMHAVYGLCLDGVNQLRKKVA